LSRPPAVGKSTRPAAVRVAIGGQDRRKRGPAENTLGGSAVGSTIAAETPKDYPFRLNLRQPIPTDFRAAYQRKALIVVKFFDERGDTFYPRGPG
jgi:hypothetical protein